LNATPRALLDWNAPLAGQSVDDLLRGVRPEDLQFLRQYSRRTGLFEYVSPNDLVVARTPTQAHNVADLFQGATGEQMYRQLAGGYGWGAAGDARASEVLRRLGVPGIRYLDQGSRAAGQGARNYVMFDDSVIDILRRYGIAALLGGGAAAGVAGTAEARQ
jgi:hypothetical protein